VLDDVAADDVDDLAVFFPRLLPVEHVAADALAVLFGRRDVLDWCVDPDVEDEVVGVVAGRAICVARAVRTISVVGIVDPPVEIAGDTPVLQAGFDPLSRLVLGVRRAFEPVEKVGEVLLELGDLEELVGAFVVLGGVAGDRGDGILDLAGFEVSLAAVVALVTAGRLAAVRAGSLDVSVR